jgi:hypothetical protein
MIDRFRTGLLKNGLARYSGSSPYRCQIACRLKVRTDEALDCSSKRLRCDLSGEDIMGAHVSEIDWRSMERLAAAHEVVSPR